MSAESAHECPITTSIICNYNHLSEFYRTDKQRARPINELTDTDSMNAHTGLFEVVEVQEKHGKPSGRLL